jgi:hypothetical protein
MEATNFDQIWSYITLHCAVQICYGVLKEGIVSKFQLSPESKPPKQNMEAGRCSEQEEQLGVTNQEIINWVLLNYSLTMGTS